MDAKPEPARAGRRGPGGPLAKLFSSKRVRGERAPHVLIIVQNLPVPFDKRVWLECQALRARGYDVTVVCPKGPGDPWFHVIDGVHIYKYRPFPPHTGPLGFPAEYAYSFGATLGLAVAARARGRNFDAIQTCNPPDIFFALAALFRLASGTRFVFDQHDLCPELFESRFPQGWRTAHRGLYALEKGTYKLADHVISTNASYRKVALVRGGKRPDQVTIVRTGPDPDRLHRRSPDAAVKRGHTHLVTYIGVMGPQDGVDLAVRAANIVVNEMGRTDVGFTFIGAGDCYEELKALVLELGLHDHVEFTGRIPDDQVSAILSTADIGLSPDPKNPLNDVSTMNKTMEYMAYELPVVAFDLVETRVSALEAAVYVPSPDIDAYAKAIVDLLDDPERREEMARFGRQRVEDVLAWRHQAPAYVAVYDRLLGVEELAPSVEHVASAGGLATGTDGDAPARRAAS